MNMKKTFSEKRSKIREFYIKTASEVFSKFGFKKTTLDDISMAAGKTKTGIYYYFQNKESVFKAVVEREIEVVKSETLQLMSELNNPTDKIAGYIKLRYKHLKELSNFYEALKSDFLEGLEFITEIRSKYDSLEIGILEGVLSEGNATGEFDVADPAKTSLAISTILKGLEIPFFVKNYTFDIENQIDELLNLLFNGIIKRN